MNDPAPIYGLVCAGGGAHGAYQVGVLKYVHEHFCHGDASPFRLFGGTSAGSLNTAFLACRSDEARVAYHELEEMWREFHVPEYHGRLLPNMIRSFLACRLTRSGRKRPRSLLDPRPLMAIVEKGYNPETLERCFKAGTTIAFAVSATELRSSRLVWFIDGPGVKSWNSGVIGLRTKVLPKHVVASCSIPFAFPPVKIGDHYFSDGGVANKRSFGPMLNCGATRILSVATDQPLSDELPEYPPGFKPTTGEVIRMCADQLRHDYATDEAMWLEVVNYFREKLGPEETRTLDQIMSGDRANLQNYDPVEIKLFAPSKRIGHTDVFDTRFYDESLKGVATALQFHTEFTGRLIEFGYEDARDRHDELAEFFTRDRPQRPSIFSTPEQGQADPAVAVTE